MIGIYSITNTSNQNVYIGSSIDITKRINSHKRDLLLQKHYNDRLQQEWVENGANAFVFEVVEETTEADLESKCNKWIEHFKSWLGVEGIYNSPILRKRKRDSRMKIHKSTEAVNSVDDLLKIAPPITFVDQSGPRSKWKVLVNCQSCESPLTIQYKTLNNQKKPTKCHSCRVDQQTRRNASKMGALAMNPSTREKRRRKISKSMKVHFSTEEAREALAAAVSTSLKGKKKKMSDAMKLKWRDAEYRDKVTKTQRKNAIEFWSAAEAEEMKQHLKKDLDDLMDTF